MDRMFGSTMRLESRLHRMLLIVAPHATGDIRRAAKNSLRMAMMFLMDAGNYKRMLIVNAGLLGCGDDVMIPP